MRRATGERKKLVFKYTVFQRKICNLRVRYVSRKSNLGTCRAELPFDEKSDRGLLKIVLTHTMFKIRCLDMDIARRSVFCKT